MPELFALPWSAFFDTPDEIAPDVRKMGRPRRLHRKLATPICPIPPTRKMIRAVFNKFKTANLAGTYRHFAG